MTPEVAQERAEGAAMGASSANMQATARVNAPDAHPRRKTRLRKVSKPASKTADELFSRIVRLRDGSCVRCGAVDPLQAAHVISRRYRAIRYDEGNCYALCLSCHAWETYHPLEGQDFWKGLIGPTNYDSLRRRALAGGRTDYRVLLTALRQRLKELESA